MNARVNLRKRSLSELGGAAKRARPAGPSKRRASVATTVRRLMSNIAETKELNTYVAATNASGGYTACINQLGEGDDDNQRNGRNVQPKSVYVDYYVTATTAMSEDTGFVACVWDKQPNQATASFATVFDTTSSTPGQAFKLNLANKDRFQVLWIEPFVRQGGGTSGGNFLNCRNRKWYDLRKFTKCEFGGTATAVPSTGALLVCMGSNTNSGTNTSAQIAYNARFAYNDY